MTKSFTEAIISAEAAKGRNATIDALSGLSGDSLRLITETFNPYRVFNIKKIALPTTYASTDAPFNFFFQLLDSLHSRTLTGDAARDAVTSVLGLYTKPTAAVLVRVLTKNLKCGAGRDTFEKVYPSLNIPKFELMLAAKIEEKAEVTKAQAAEGKVALSEAILAKKYGLVFPVIAESKYDGNRLVAFVENGIVTYNSRSGKPSDHLDGLFDDELVAMEKEVGVPIVVDGEVLADSFQETMKAKGSGNDAAKSTLKFWAFDIMSLQAWNRKHCHFNQKSRSSFLYDLLKKLGLKKVVKSKSKVCHSIKELRDFYAQVLLEGNNDDGTKNGLGEGLIIKNMNGSYEWDRSKNWFKWKPVIDLDLEIVGYEMGNGRLSKTVGKLLLRGRDENGTLIEARCGSGLSDKDREFFLVNGPAMLGKTVMIEAQEISLAQNATVHSARFPIYIKIRDDK